MAKFTAGDTVRLVNRMGKVRGTATVTKVLKTRLVLDNGWRTDLDGFKIENGTRLIGAHIEQEA